MTNCVRSEMQVACFTPSTGDPVAINHVTLFDVNGAAFATYYMDDTGAAIDQSTFMGGGVASIGACCKDACFLDEVTNTIAPGNRIATHESVAGDVVDIYETVTAISTNADGELVYTDEEGNDTVYVPPAPVSAVDSINLRPTGTPNEFTVEITYTDDAGNTSTIVDATPITIAGGPVYITCDGTPLTITDRITTAPTAFRTGHMVNQEVAGECLFRADILYNLARRSITGGENYLNNDAQGYGSVIANGINNEIAAGGSYSFIGAGNGNEITRGYSAVVGGLQNDITGGTYSTITGGYQNVSTGNYNTTGGYRNTNGGYANTVGGYRNVVTANRSLVHGDSNTVAATMNNVLGFSHVVAAGSYNLIAGYDHTNTNGTYGAMFGLRHTNTAGNNNTMGGTTNTNTAGSSNTLFGSVNRNISGSYNFLAGRLNTTDGNYNWTIGYSNAADGVGNFVAGYNNSSVASYGVAIGRNANNTVNNGILIGSAINRIGFFGTQPVARPTLNSATATTTQIVIALETLGLVG